jgi:type IV pilus assembly protein PilA
MRYGGREAAASRRRDGGFSLIELTVVVLVIAILLAVGIPTFLGAKQQTNDRAVQSTVRNAFTAARVYYTGKLEYTSDTVAMTTTEPTIIWTNTQLDGAQLQNTVYVETQNFPSTNQTVIVVGRSKAGRCFYLRDVMSGSGMGTFYEASVPAGANCSVPLLNDPGWGSSWPK